MAGREMLDLGHAVHRVVIGLADHRAVDAEAVADVADLGDPPGAIIRDAEIAHLALPDQFAHRAHGLVQRRRVIFLMQIIDVDIVGAEPLQAFVGGLQHPASRQSAAVGIVAHGVGELGREYQSVPAVGNGAADHLLGIAARIGVGGIDEVDAGLARLGDDPRRRRLVGRPAEHHGAQAYRRDFQAAAAELTILHRLVLRVLIVIPGRCEASNPESRDSGSGPTDHPGMTESLRLAPRDGRKRYASFFNILNTPLAMAMQRLSTVTSVVMKIRLRVERTTCGFEIRISPILPASTKWVSS